jgi:hypothetical protein
MTENNHHPRNVEERAGYQGDRPLPRPTSMVQPQIKPVQALVPPERAPAPSARGARRD